MKKAWKHLRTISRHRHQVIKHAYKAGILWQGLRHDLSKYSPSEFLVGIRYATGDKSPNEGERAEYGYSKAWLHHKGRNKHHFEYWTDYNIQTKRVEPVEMPIQYVIEMFCDRVAASKTYEGKDYTNDHPLSYFLKGKAHRDNMIHPQTSHLLEEWLRLLAQEGETAAFSAMRAAKKKKCNEKKN